MKKTVCIILLCVLLIGCIALGLFIYDNSQKVDEDLITNLIVYLQGVNGQYDLISRTFATKINDIKNGEQPLHIEIDPSNYYYVCGYYNPSHENASRDKYESEAYCCVTEYTWVKFRSEKEIREYHNGKKMIVAFQINEALFVKDILSEEAKVPGFTHFQIYETCFIDGFNTNEPIVLEKTFIYLFNGRRHPYREQVYRGHIYHSTEVYDNKLVTFPCVSIDGRYYIPVWLQTIYPSGEHSDAAGLAIEFGEYYDTLVNIMITDKYSITSESGATAFYGLLEINEFAKAVFK